MKTAALAAALFVVAVLAGIFGGRAVTARARRIVERSIGKLDGLRSAVAERAEQMLTELAREGILVVVTDGFRTYEEQDALFAQGRTKPGPIVTPLRGGESWHNFGLAFDVAVLDAAGKLSWPQDDLLWEKIGRAGEAAGLSWGGRFPPEQRDRPHFEFRVPGYSIGDARAGVPVPQGAA